MASRKDIRSSMDRRARVREEEIGGGPPLSAEEAEDTRDTLPDQPFAEGAQDALGPDLRHRLISEAAYRHYVDRGYEDGYDLDDWLQAEAEVDHLLLNPSPTAGGAA